MKRLILLAIVAAAAWYGWKHYGELRSASRDVAVIDNQASIAMERVRLTACGSTYVAEEIPAGTSATLPFPVSCDGELTMVWQLQGSDRTYNWSGGEVTSGPIRSRHHLQVTGDGGVVWTSERIVAPPK